MAFIHITPLVLKNQRVNGHNLTFTYKEHNEMLLYAPHILKIHEQTVNLLTPINGITAHKKQT
jgi:hypothetical protein